MICLLEFFNLKASSLREVVFAGSGVVSSEVVLSPCFLDERILERNHSRRISRVGHRSNVRFAGVEISLFPG
jgi:hypothetical protein